MARKNPPERLPPPKLVVPRAQVGRELEEQIAKGRLIRDSAIASHEQLEEARSARNRWSDYNEELLGRRFDNLALSDEYSRSGSVPIVFIGDSTFDEDVRDFRQSVSWKLDTLESIHARLPLMPDLKQESADSEMAEGHPPIDKRVFVVHGHDEGAKQAVARFLEKLDLDPIILHEQPNAGRTIIEKFEDYANVGFAVILLTPDDLGNPMDRPNEMTSRARQNVVFELGYFFGKIGRGRVCALHKKDVELPTDVLGILWVPMDPAGAWQLKVAQEMRYAGIDVDLNKLA